jgi:major vault protein
MAENIIRIPPFRYIHVLNNNSNLTRLEKGPMTFIRKEHETVIAGPLDMVRLPTRTFCVIQNPVVLDAPVKGNPVLTDFGQVKINHGETETRTYDDYPDPFPLYPGEEMVGKVEKYVVVGKNQAIKLVALKDFKDAEGKVNRVAGDEWLIIGPVTYIPRVEAEIVASINAEVIKNNTALKLRAKRQCEDSYGQKRITGEEWLIREAGSYLPRNDEEVVKLINGIVITDKKALKLRATKNFTDIYKQKRRAGEEWLITSKIAQLHIPDVYEEIVGEVPITTLTNRQYCMILDPYSQETKSNLYGTKVLIKGEISFFLYPGERLEGGKIQQIEVLGEDEALLLRAKETFKDDEKAENKGIRKPGEKWMITGPREYTPPVEVEIMERKRSIPLDENEGIYVRDNSTGEVRMVKGKTYLLSANEELWKKELPEVVEYLIAMQKNGQAYVPPSINAKGELVYDQKAVSKSYVRDKTRVVTFRAPHNSAVQLYDYKCRESRVVFGPDLVMLGPDEHFTVISLSGGIPKREGVINSLALNLGPDFMRDVVLVETSDHARLNITLTYNWQFKYIKDDQDSCKRLFQVKDFIGDACKSLASRIRGAVSSVSFDEFHKKRKDLLQNAVFGTNPDGTSKGVLMFPMNFLCITSVDVQNPEPVDPRMRDSLMKSQTLNIDITTKKQELAARHQAMRQEQESRGELEIQKYNDYAQAESAKKELLVLQAETEAIKTSGSAVSEAKAIAEAELIKIGAQVDQARFKAQAIKIESDADISAMTNSHKAEILHKAALYDLEVLKAREMSEIEVGKFKETVKAIGAPTLIAIAKSGPEMKAKMLNSLGLKGFMTTDGKNPINLFNTANGIINGMGAMGSMQ